MNSKIRQATADQNTTAEAKIYKHPSRFMFEPFGLEANVTSATHLSAALAPGRGWAGPAAGAVVMKPVLAIKPGSCQLGMANAAPANERELNGL
jgi:hypothetical protein